MLGKCPNCNGRFEIQPDWVGKQSECPYCHKMIEIHDDEQQSAIDLQKNAGDRASSEIQNPVSELKAVPVNEGAMPPNVPPPPAGTPFNPGCCCEIAGIGERFLAMLIDGFILGLVGMLIVFLPAVILGVVLCLTMDNKEMAINLATKIAQLFSNFIGAIIGMAYEAYFLPKYGATPGKMVFDMKVKYNGANLTIARSIGRYWARQLSGCICLIGYIMAFFNPEHKALHDSICETIVVKERKQL